MIDLFLFVVMMFPVIKIMESYIIIDSHQQILKGVSY